MARSETQKVVDNTVETILKNQKAADTKRQVRDSKKAAANDVDDDNEDEDDNSGSAVAMFSSETLKFHINKYMAAIEKKDQANADVKSALDAAEKAGIPKGELKFVVKHRKKKLSEDFKANVNIMNEMLGDLPLFSFRDPADHQLITHVN